MSRPLSIQDLEFTDSKVLVRVDFNVPLSPEGAITDDTRIRAALPTIKHILENGGSLILMSHLGRPKGKFTPSLSLAPCAKRLTELLGSSVKMAEDCIGNQTKELAGSLQKGEILLLENLRFHSAETHPEEDPSFAQQLSELADYYVNDAFGTAHREHSSTFTIVKHFPEKAAAGFLLTKEIDFLEKVFHRPEHPFVAMIGGAKVSSKIGVLKALMDKADTLVIGGGMTFTFLKAQGIPIGDSLCEDEFLPVAEEILALSQEKGTQILLPPDLVVADRFHNDANTQVIETNDGVPDGFQGLDIGPKATQSTIETLKQAKTIFWNGPFGVFELPTFAQGTHAIARALTKVSGTTIIGGGDSVAAINQLGLGNQVSHLSTGGGAALEYIEFGKLPGIEALSKQRKLAK